MVWDLNPNEQDDVESSKSENFYLERNELGKLCLKACCSVLDELQFAKGKAKLKYAYRIPTNLDGVPSLRTRNKNELFVPLFIRCKKRP